MAESLDDARVAELLDEYLVAARAGRAPEREAFVATHPEVGAALRQALHGLEFIGAPAPEERVLGDFRLVKEIGRGGMGVVYEAEQISLRRPVALKVLPFAGVLDQKQLSRFRHEAQAAALLHHTHIVPVYAVGQERGVHYFAMQLVDGMTLAAVVEEVRGRRGPGSSAAVEALASGRGAETQGYCRAVAKVGACAAEALEHAHQHGVVHRDVKPGNLMLDGSGHLWVTDFGLACGRSEASLTVTGDLVGTVAYMSPEQAAGRPVDHRTDVYSLGATLYEVLTLHRAFDAGEPHQVLARIATEEPPLPRSWNRAIPAELETILLKSMWKEPSGRYPTAQEMADDLRRFLDNRPVLAKRPTLLDRAGKWARRHRAAVAVGAAFTALLVIGLAVGTVLLARERSLVLAERQEAERNLRVARDAVDEMLANVGHEGLRDVPMLEPLRRKLLERAAVFYRGLVGRHGDDPALRHDAGEALRRLGHVHRLLGEHALAEQSYEEAAERLDDLTREFPGVEAYRESLTKALEGWGWLCHETGRPADAERRFRRALGLWEGRHPASRGGRAALADMHLSLGSTLGQRGDDRGDESETRLALDLLEELLQHAPDERLRHGRLAALNSLGAVLRRKGLHRDVAAAYRETVDLAEWLVATSPTDPYYRYACGDAHHNLGVAFADLGQPAEAVRELRRAVEIYETLARDFPSAPRHRHVLGSGHRTLANTLIETGDLEEAERHCGEAVRILGTLVQEHGDVPVYAQDLAHAHWIFCCVLRGRARPEAAEEHARTAVDAYERLVAQEPTSVPYRSELAKIQDALGQLLHGRGRIDEAERAYRAAIEQFAELERLGPLPPQDRHHRGGALVNLGNLLSDARKPTEAEEAYRDAIEDLRDLVSHFPDAVKYREYLANGWLSLGALLRKTGRSDEAAQCFAEGCTQYAELERMCPDALAYRGGRARCLRALGEHLWARGEAAEAEQAFRECMRLREEIILADPSAANSMELATVLDHLGAFLLKERPAEAEDLFRKGLDLREALLREAPDDPARQAALGGTLHNRANALSSLGRVPETPALYERAIGLQRAALAKAPQSPDSQRFLRLHCLHLSNSLIVLGEHARGAVAAAELPVLDPESAADHWEAGRRLMICADLAGKDERLDPADRTRVALEYAHKARTILGRATQLAPGDTMCWGALGWACVGAEDWEGAVAALDRDLGPGVGPFEWFLLATAHARLGHAEEARRWYDEAVAWMDEHRANDKLRTQRAGVERLLGIAEKH